MYTAASGNGENTERTVHIGSAFWAAATDDKTRAGTLIHELSHFHSVGYTEDVGYYQHQNAGDFPGIDPEKVWQETPIRRVWRR